ncbi:hypothetical protein M440DRAFT_1403065, partial [Trichoderma longibrachiatum ATCC 18648]
METFVAGSSRWIVLVGFWIMPNFASEAARTIGDEPQYAVLAAVCITIGCRVAGISVLLVRLMGRFVWENGSLSPRDAHSAKL